MNSEIHDLGAGLKAADAVLTSGLSVEIFDKEPVKGDGLKPYNGKFGEDEVLHLLKRAMFGARKEDLDYFKGRSFKDAIAELTTVPELPTTAPLKDYQAIDKKTNEDRDPDVVYGQSWTTAADNGKVNGQRRDSLRKWWLGLMVRQNRSIQEKMVLFWDNHFSNQLNNFPSSNAYWRQMTLRRNAMGNFRTFLKEITLDPAMLRYLNGGSNNKNAPDENYGRELQELFTIGKGPDSHYTEGDVKAAARVLTGWVVKNQTKDQSAHSEFVPGRHDPNDKTFSAFYKNTVIKGRPADGGAEIDDLISMILNNPESAKFICRKLYRFFVYYKIDDAVEKDVIAPLADIFRKNNYEIKPVMQALLGSRHFFDPSVRGCMIKSPVDYVVGLTREFNIVFPEDALFKEQYNGWNVLLSNNGVRAQGQQIGDPPNVAGWPAYYEAPQYHQLWLNTDSYPRRLRFADQLFTPNGYGLGGGSKVVIDVVNFAAQFAHPDNADELINDAAQFLYQIPATPEFKTRLKASTLLSGQISDHYWTDAWNAYRADPTNKEKANVVIMRLQGMLKGLVDRSEYQIC